MNSNIKIIGMDIAKNVFALVGLEEKGKIIYKKMLARDMVLPTFRNMPATKVAIESCSGSHYWARQLQALGREVILIAAQHTRACVTGNKNDYNDAAAIAESGSRASTKTVAINTEAQQDLQILHRARQALMKERTALINRARAFAGEYGKVFALGIARIRAGLIDWLQDENHGLSGSAHHSMMELKEQWDDKETRIATYDQRLQQAAKEDVRARRLLEIPGVGKLTATAVIAAVSDARYFKMGRDFATNLGIIPREHSSGGKQRLYGITKRGDSYLRTLLIHGARSALHTAGKKSDRLLNWAFKIAERRGVKVAAVALANKCKRLLSVVTTAVIW